MTVTAFVTYDPASGEVSVEPDPLVVEKGDHGLQWEKKNPAATWRFVDLQVMSHQHCFADKMVDPEKITMLDKNRDATCHGTISYTITVADGDDKVEEIDPVIDNKPG